MERRANDRRVCEPDAPTEYRWVASGARSPQGGGSRSRATTSPEMPASKRGSANTEPRIAAAPPSVDEVLDLPFEVWRVHGGQRAAERAFANLGEALRFVHSHTTGRFDVRLPDGSWFSENKTIRSPREG